jgi:hypothetical protein
MKANQIVWDSENKEYVVITNGIPITENFKETGRITPTEAIALRVIGLDDKEGGKPVLAFTYRKVNAEKLSVLDNPDAAKWIKDYIIGKPINKHYRFAGRV